MNQPPTQKPTGKRIVSKGEYIMTKVKKVWLYFDALALLVFMPYMGYKPFSHLNLSPFWFFVVMIGVTILSTFVFIKPAVLTFQKARMLDNVAPLTHANTADLPAPDSLVRASAEPVQEPQAVLLRAATDTQERHVEQLVRVSARGME